MNLKDLSNLVARADTGPFARRPNGPSEASLLCRPGQSSSDYPRVSWSTASEKCAAQPRWARVVVRARRCSMSGREIGALAHTTPILSPGIQAGPYTHDRDRISAAVLPNLRKAIAAFRPQCSTSTKRKPLLKRLRHGGNRCWAHGAPRSTDGHRVPRQAVRGNFTVAPAEQSPASAPKRPARCRI